MQKISAIIFSRNNMQELFELIYYIYDYVDQIVVVDSSSMSKFKLLKAREKTLKKLNAYYAVALGLLEPIRPYGLDRCKYDWILHLDVDERPSDDLKRDLRGIPERSSDKAYRIRRIGKRERGGPGSELGSWQIRLYNRKYVEFKGMVHELPIVKGSIGELEDRYHILHLPHKAERHYQLLEKLEEFNRITYRELNSKVGSKTGLLLKIYKKATLKEGSNELSNLDYFAFTVTKEVLRPLLIKEIGIGEAVRRLNEVRRRIKKIGEWKKSPESRIALEISNIIAAEGIVKYLNLRDEKVIEVLNKKYANKEQGVNLLIKLLVDKYNGEYP